MARINARRFSKIMRDLARLPSRVSTDIAASIAEEIEKRMDAGQDPYGNNWKLKYNGKRSRLKRTGRGRASIKVRAQSGAGIRITVGILYMVYHQFGGKSHLRGYKKNPNFGRDKDRSTGRENPPTRSFLPFDELPKRWEKIIQRRIEAEYKRRINGK